MAILGTTSEPTTGQEWFGLNTTNQYAILVTLPAGGPWRIYRLGAWLAGKDATPDVKLCVWTAAGTLARSSATFTAASQSFALGHNTNYERDITEYIVPGGTQVYIGFSRDDDVAVQFGTRSGTRIQNRDETWPGNLVPGNTSVSGAIGAYLYYEQANDLPTAPTLVSPASGAVLTDTTPALDWTHNDPDGDAQSGYQVQVDDSSAFGSPAWDSGDVTSSTSSATVGVALSRGVTYWWRVRTRDAEGFGPWSGGRSFTINQLPNAPSLVSPSDGAALTDFAPSLVFDHSDPDGNAIGVYDLQVSSDGSFGTVTHWNIANQTTGISGNRVTRTYAGVALSSFTTYYWRARTSDSNGEYGPWSSARTFSVFELRTDGLIGAGGGTATFDYSPTITALLLGNGGGGGVFVSGGLKVLIGGIDLTGFCQIGSIRARQLVSGTSSLDFTLIDPASIPALGDTAEIEHNGVLWAGTINAVKEIDFLTKQLWVDITATNETAWPPTTAPHGLSDNPDEVTTFGYRDLQVEQRRDSGGDTTNVNLTTYHPGIEAGATVEITNALHGWVAEPFDVTEIAISWDPDENHPIYSLALGTKPDKLGNVIKDAIEDDAPGYVIRPQQVNITGATAGADALTAKVSGDTEKRLTVLADGTLQWSDGTNPADTTLARTGAGVLDLGGKLVLEAQDGVTEGGEITLNGAGAQTPWTMDVYSNRIRWHKDGLEKLSLYPDRLEMAGGMRFSREESYFRAYKTASQSIANNTWTILTGWNGANFNRGGFSWNASTGILTVPRDSIYLIIETLTFGGSSAGNERIIAYVSSSGTPGAGAVEENFGQHYSRGNYTGTPRLRGALIYKPVGDRNIAVTCYQDSGGALSVTAAKLEIIELSRA